MSERGKRKQLDSAIAMRCFAAEIIDHLENGEPDLALEAAQYMAGRCDEDIAAYGHEGRVRWAATLSKIEQTRWQGQFQDGSRDN